MVDVGEALGHPHDAHDGDHLPWHSSCACGAFLSLLEHYGWCSSRILRLGGEDAFDDVLYRLYGGDAWRRFMRGCLSMKILISWRLLMYMLFGCRSCLD